MSKPEKKSKTISLRCSEGDYARLKALASGNQQSISEALLDTRVPKRIRKSREKRLIPIVVVLQETVNEMENHRNSDSEDGLDSDLIDKIAAEVKKLWEL